MPGEYQFFLKQIYRTWPLLLQRLHADDFDAWLLCRWITQALLLTLLILAIDYGTGAGVLSLLRLRVAGRLRPLAALTCGIGLQGLFLFLLGACGWLSATTVRLGCLALGIAGAAIAWKRGHLRIPFAWPKRRWILAACAPVALLYLCDWMQPVAEGDSTMYHMASARWYRQHHALPYHPEIRFNAQPQLSVLLYLRHWLATGEDTLLKTFNLELAVLLWLALIAGLKELRLRERWLPAMIVLAAPVFVWVSKIEYADLALAAFATSGGVLLLAALRRHSVALAALGGVALAMAGGNKLQGLVLAATFTAAFGWSSWRRAWAPRQIAVTLALIGSAIVLFGAGWWIRSFAATGSPAYPFFTQEPDLERLMAVNKTYGFGRGLDALLLLPWRAFREAPANFADAYSYGPVLLLLAASLPFLWPQRRAKSLQFIALALALFFGFWFVSGQVTRYWASTVGLQALLITAALRTWAKPLAAALLLVALGNIAITSPTLLNGWPPPVRLAQKETVQAETLDYYRAARALNQMATGDQRVYTWYSENAKFHLLTNHAGDWFGPHGYFWLTYGAKSETEIVERLRNADYHYLLLDRKRGAIRAGMFDFDFLKSEFMRTWGTPPGTARVYDDGQYVAFRIER